MKRIVATIVLVSLLLGFSFSSSHPHLITTDPVYADGVGDSPLVP